MPGARLGVAVSPESFMENLPSVRHLRHLIALADHAHFGHAAEASFVTQSTLSAPYGTGPSKDLLLIEDVFEDRADMLRHTSIVGDDVVIRIDDNNSITLRDASPYLSFGDILIA